MSIFLESAFDSAEPEEVLASARAEVRYDIPEGVILKKAVSGDIDVESGFFQVIFYTNGSASGGKIFLTNDRGRSACIQIDFITGMVALTAPEHAG